MTYQVLYRKYRPGDFSEVVGQDHVVAVIRRQLATGRVAHAYLFSGPRGVGKTSIARLLAKAVNCTGSPQPCNKCPTCQVFNSGQAMNLIEIDAASNRGIDEIRELREAVRYLPTEGGRKVYIIDEVHQLTKEAFNALLKTLEEPPAHAVFVLATTELDKVPATIISRTQHFDFRRPRAEIVSRRLQSIAEREGITLDADAAETMAFVAEGSLRDAESLLGKALAVADRAITAADVEEILGVPSRRAVADLFRLIGARDAKGALAFVNQLYNDGFEMEYLIKLLIAFFRRALLAKTDPALQNNTGARITLAEDGLTEESLASYAAEDLARAILELIEAIVRSRRTPIPQLPLELAIVSIIGESRT